MRTLYEWAGGAEALDRLTEAFYRRVHQDPIGPACLRLRVVADPATVDPRFLVDEDKLERIAAVIDQHWPESLHSDDLQNPALIRDVETARSALLDTLDLAELN